jgi:hypothetical protein
MEMSAAEARLVERSTVLWHRLQLAIAELGEEHRELGMGAVEFGCGMMTSLLFEAAQLTRVMGTRREDFMKLVETAWRSAHREEQEE